MATQQHSATMEKLPWDALSHIFIRLLAKQLAQMRCVSKSWNAFLSQSSFIKSHLHRSRQNPKNDDILLFFPRRFSFRSTPITARPSRSPHLELPNFIKLPAILQSKNTCGNVVGSVNGLICFNYGPLHHSTYYIWNPSLSAVLTLPPSAFPSHDYDIIGISPRFGYDPKTDDYKLVKVTGAVEPPDMMFQSSQRFNFHLDSEDVDYKVEVYSMRKGSWKLITQRFPSHISMYMYNNEVCFDGYDGHLHWIGHTELEWSQETIVAFDLSAETFREIPLPDPVRHNLPASGSPIDYKVHRKNVLGISDGKLCVMSSIQDGYYYDECEVWLMEEYGMAESWVKLHVLSDFTMVDPFGFTLHNEFLFQVDEHEDEEVVDHRFGLYDSVAAKVKIFKSRSAISKVVEYVDSLVWVTPDDHETSCCCISRLQI